MCLGSHCGIAYQTYDWINCATETVILNTSGIVLSRTPSFPSFEESCDFDTAFSYTSAVCPVTKYKVTVTDPNNKKHVVKWTDANADGSWTLTVVTSEAGNYG